MSNLAARSVAERDSRRTFASALWTATTIIAVVIISRRMGGHFANALHPLTATLIAGLLSAINVTAALLARSDRAPAARFAQKRRNASIAISLLTTVPPMALGLSVLPSGAIGGLSAILTIALLSGLIVLASGLDGDRPLRVTAERERGNESGESVVNDELTPTAVPRINEGEELELNEPIDDESLAVSQSMSRSTGVDGTETIEGTVLLSFATGQQIGVVHLPFSPQLCGQPQVSCHLLNDRPVRIRVTTAQSYGARLEAKRTENALIEEDILIGYVITAENTRANAA